MSETTPDQKGAAPGRLFADTGEDDETRDIFAELDSLAKTAADDMGVETVMISVVQGEQLHTLGSFPAIEDDIEARRHVPLDTVCMRTIERNGMLRVEDATKDNRLHRIPYVTRGGIMGYLGVPIDTAAHGTIGSLCAISSTPRAWTDFEQRYMEQLSRTVALTLLAGMRLVEQRQLSEELTELDKIIATLAAELSVPTSIYTETGEMAFANAALTALVPMDLVATYAGRRGADTDEIHKFRQSRTLEISASSGQPSRFRVVCSRSASGMMVCHWFPNPGEVN